MSTLFDLAGFLSVVVHGLDLVARLTLCGSVVFALVIAVPLAADGGPDGAGVLRSTRHIVQAAALGSVATVAVATSMNAALLAGSLATPWGEVIGAHFVIAGVVSGLAAGAIFVLASVRLLSAWVSRIAVGVLAATLMCALLADSHAVARLEDRDVMLVASGLHAAGAAIWLGGLPCFRMALWRAEDPKLRALIGRRYSLLSMIGVGLIIAGAVPIATGYIGSVDAVYGTAYGAMAVAKGILFGTLLVLGLANFMAVRRFCADPAAVGRVRRFVAVEMGVGVAVLMAAASITSLPPAIDLVDDRLPLAEIKQRMTPTLPRLHSPEHDALARPARLDELSRGQQSLGPAPPAQAVAAPNARNAQDIAWSEYNHHWAGLLVVTMGLAALAERSGWFPWAKHWPLLFVCLAGFVFVRADPEVWPMGDIGFFASLKDPEVVQHRMFVLLITAFAFFEWGVRTGRIVSRRLTRVFPLMTVIGGTLLLTHSHALGHIKEELLIEYTHLPIAILGIGAGWSRWLEIEAPRAEGRWAGWLWPICFVLIGLLLLGYREA